MCTEKGATDPQESDTKPKSEKHDAFEKVTLATAVVGVVILCIYTGLTGYQAYIAKDTAQRQLRAYISAVVEKWPDLDSPGIPQVVFVFKNNGQTPAYRVDARVTVFIGGDSLTETDIEDANKRLEKLRNSESVVFPGQRI
jgi:hypothetical protein